jgi:probable rRNA maturation factor
MIDVTIEIDPDYNAINKRVSTKILKSTLQKEQINKAKINLIFAKDKLLNNLKIKFFNKDHLTDVIAFRINDYSDEMVEGEIYISIERAIYNAKKYEQDISKELARLIIHGTLHLLNYKDEMGNEKLLMTKKENQYLEDFEWINIF